MKLLQELKPLWLGLLCRLLDLVGEDGRFKGGKKFAQDLFFDWPSKDNPEATEAGVYALLAIALRVGGRLCRTVGEDATATKCDKTSALLGNEARDHHGMKQVAATMYLAGHLSNERAGEFLTENGGEGMSTFHSYYLLKAVTQSVGIEPALEMLKEYYGGMLDVGATTFWEDFDLAWLRDGARIDRMQNNGEYDIHAENGRFCYAGLRHSLCHGWSAGPVAFLADTVLGIEILEAGCRKVAVKPQLGSLEWAKGSYPTPYGDITVSVTKDGVEISAPAEVEVCTP